MYAATGWHRESIGVMLEIQSVINIDKKLWHRYFVTATPDTILPGVVIVVLLMVHPYRY